MGQLFGHLPIHQLGRNGDVWSQLIKDSFKEIEPILILSSQEIFKPIPCIVASLCMNILQLHLFVWISELFSALSLSWRVNRLSLQNPQLGGVYTNRNYVCKGWFLSKDQMFNRKLFLIYQRIRFLFFLDKGVSKGYSWRKIHIIKYLY